jgi:hypothetical protein
MSPWSQVSAFSWLSVGSALSARSAGRVAAAAVLGLALAGRR